MKFDTANMSATFKNAKKMVKQEQLRKLMKDHKKVQKEVKKIDSPLAKYPFLTNRTFFSANNYLYNTNFP